jgi:curli biogenesis system outer membrane secretion channel CsgG
MRRLLTILGLVLGLAAEAGAQPAAAAPRAKRVKLAVMSFDYGTVSNPWWGDADIGKGVADQIVDRLVNDGTFSVIERRQLDTVLAEQDFARTNRADPNAKSLARIGKVMGIRYIVAGSITAFGSEQKNYGAGMAGAALGPVGMLKLKKAKTEVALTARLIDTTTGEVLLSATGSGLSKKGGGISLALPKTPGMSGLDMGSDDYRSSAIGEAQDLACTQVVEALLAKATTLLAPGVATLRP